MNTTQRPIQEYLSLIGSLIIDQFNERYKNFNDEQFKEEADTRFTEKDWVYKIGDFFKDLAYYETQSDIKEQGHNDISIPSKDFAIEVKYPRNYNSSSGTRSGSGNWNVFQKDFDWLEESLKDPKMKGKRAFVIIWCNSVDYFGQIMQLGDKPGSCPEGLPDKIVYFPFLSCHPTKEGKNYTKNMTYNYDKPEGEVNLNHLGRPSRFDCLFLGQKNDRIHMAIYY